MTVTTGISEFLSPQVYDPRPNGAAPQDVLATDLATCDDFRDAWNRVIDQKLIEWGRNPDQIEESDLIPPSKVSVGYASDFASNARDANWPPPMRVVPNGDGGIVFERWFGPITQCFEFESDGSVEFIEFHNHRVVRSQKLA